MDKVIEAARDGEGYLIDPEEWDADVAQETFEEGFEDGFIYEIEHFAGLYLSGKKESDLVPLSDSIDCARVFDELRKDWGRR